jgi:hypothetical protein
MKPRHLALGAALLVAAAFAFFGDKSPAGGVVEAAPRNAAANAKANAKASAPVAVPEPKALDRAAPTQNIIALIPRELLTVGEAGPAASVFNAQNWTPPPPPPPKPAPPPPPTAPPLPFTYIGKAQEQGRWEVFLSRGSETLIVRSPMVVDGVYRIDSIAPPTMTLTYLPLKQVQQMNIGVPD